jgi:hypothetical protein
MATETFINLDNIKLTAEKIKDYIDQKIVGCEIPPLATQDDVTAMLIGTGILAIDLGTQATFDLSTHPSSGWFTGLGVNYLKFTVTADVSRPYDAIVITVNAGADEVRQLEIAVLDSQFNELGVVAETDVENITFDGQLITNTLGTSGYIPAGTYYIRFTTTFDGSLEKLDYNVLMNFPEAH